MLKNKKAKMENFYKEQAQETKLLEQKEQEAFSAFTQREDVQ